MTTFLISCAAVYYCSYLVSLSEGPFEVFKRVRESTDAKSNLGRGIRCPMCSSMWVSAVITAYLWWFGRIETDLAPLLAIASAGVSAFAHTVDGY